MRKINVCEIDRKVNGKKSLACNTAITRVARYIKKDIDKTFPEEAFISWCDSSSDKNFRWNKIIYFWGN